eukprot:192123-Rhodomonas_salina.1
MLGIYRSGDDLPNRLIQNMTPKVRSRRLCHARCLLGLGGCSALTRAVAAAVLDPSHLLEHRRPHQHQRPAGNARLAPPLSALCSPLSAFRARCFRPLRFAMWCAVLTAPVFGTRCVVSLPGLHAAQRKRSLTCAPETDTHRD